MWGSIALGRPVRGVRAVVRLHSVAGATFKALGDGTRAIIAGALILAWTAPAIATGPSHSSGSATAILEISGRISSRCSIDLDDRTISVTLNEAGGSRSVPFSVDCNRPMQVHLTSRFGGLSHVTHQRGEEYRGFTGFIPYRASFDVTAQGADVVTANSEEMKDGVTGSVGVTPYRANGTFGVTWQASEPLLGGNYSDVIEIRIVGG